MYYLIVRKSLVHLLTFRDYHLSGKVERLDDIGRECINWIYWTVCLAFDTVQMT